MPSCLIIEQDGYWSEQIRSALTSEGWPVRIVQDPKNISANTASADLVFVGTDLAEAEALLRRFSRRGEGGCSVALAPPEPAPVEPGVEYEADGVLRKPFTEAQLWSTVRSLLSSRVVAGPSSGDKLTSKEIFGDMLAELTDDPKPVVDPELESALAGGAAPESPPRPRRGSEPAPPSRRRQPSGRSDEDLQRKLEETLSGVLSPELLNPDLLKAKTRPPVAPLKRDTTDVDKLLSDTLSGLDLGNGRRRGPSAEKSSTSREAKPSATEDALPEDPFRDLEASFLNGVFEKDEKAPQAKLPTNASEEELLLENLLVDDPSNTPEAPQEETPLEETGAPVVLQVPILEVDGMELESSEPELQLAEIENEISMLEESLALPEPEAEPEPPPRTGDSPTAAGQLFGHYTLLERIAVGGMAEVWKARMDGVAGFQKTVAIKKILPHLTENEQFQRMFVDEARLAAELNHPNITHIYDLGVLQGDYYIAMEYVEGRNLRAILNLASRKGQPIPHELALLIASRLASALDYAHRKRDADDQELGLVHRDVSPQNVLVSYEGDIKLCDFGIVKAVTKLSETESGALKGKLQYMSPEQAWGREVDSRSDIFSIGSLLFEMLTGLRLFSGETELSVLEAVRSGRTRRPRDFDPTIPDAVDDLVAQAVAQDPADRFQRAGRMRDQIESIFEQLTLRPSNADLASYLRRLVSAPDVEENLDTGPTGRIEKVARFALPDSTTDGETGGALEADQGAPFVEAVSPVLELPSEDGKSRRGVLIAAIFLLLTLGVAAAFFFGRDRAAVSPPAATAPAAAEEPPAPLGADPIESPGAGAAASSGDTAASEAGETLDLLARERERIQQEVTAQIAIQEEELRKTYEAKERQLKSKLASLKEAEGQEPAAADDGSDVVPPGPGVKSPVLVSIDKPQYSAEARLAADKTEVVLYLLVNQNGQVEQVRQAQGSNLDPGVNEAAIRAARAAVFKPATKDGRRVKMWTTLKIPLPS